jgi:hypothetical protein
MNLRKFTLDGRVRIAIIALFIALIGITIYFTYIAFSLPTLVERNVSICSYEHRGDFTFLVYLKPNILYDTTTLGPGEKLYFTKITDQINTSLSYIFIIDRPANVNSQVEVIGELVTDKWRKSYVLNKTTFDSNEFTINLPFSPNLFLDEVDKINRDLGVYTSKIDLKLIYNIRTIAKTDLKEIDEVFTPIVTIALTKTDFNITGSQYRKTGAIEKKEVFLQKDVIEKRNLSTIATCIAIGALISFSLLTTNKVVGRKEAILAKAEKKYGDWIANAVKLPEAKEFIALASFDDLVKVAGELGKPIVHKTGEQHAYYVFDGALRYEYILSETPEEVEIKAAEFPEVLNLIVPEKVLQGEEVKFTIKFMNKSKKPLKAIGYVEIREQAGKVIELVNSEEALVKAGEMVDIAIAWNSDNKIGGYWAIAWVKYNSNITQKTYPKRFHIMEKELRKFD